MTETMTKCPICGVDATHGVEYKIGDAYQPWQKLCPEHQAVLESLPALVGSEKQIDWAWSIRNEQIVRLLKSRAGKAAAMGAMPAVVVTRVLAGDDAEIARLSAETSAKFWIDRR